jgi:YHS domain-containing protein
VHFYKRLIWLRCAECARRQENVTRENPKEHEKKQERTPKERVENTREHEGNARRGIVDEPQKKLSVLPILHAQALAKDPVCGMSVDPVKAAGKVEHAGTLYYFCSRGCVERFSKEPGKYLTVVPATGVHPAVAARSAAMHAVAATDSRAPSETLAHARARENGGGNQVRYTCPMHPEIIQLGPGSCPKCGMALEPMDVVAGEEQSDPEYDSMWKRFWVAVALSAPLLVASMLERCWRRCSSSIFT